LSYLDKNWNFIHVKFNTEHNSNSAQNLQCKTVPSKTLRQSKQSRWNLQQFYLGLHAKNVLA